MVENELLYELEPSKVAMIWYVPSAVGVQEKPKLPAISLVAMPRSV